jgi:hypothetical protein
MINSTWTGEDKEGTGRGHFDISWSLPERLKETTGILSQDCKYLVYDLNVVLPV